MTLEAQKKNLCLALALCSVFIMTWCLFQNQRVIDMLQTGREANSTPVERTRGSELQSTGVKQRRLDGGWYNFTVVSALIDIGRGNWTRFTRSYDDYLKFFHQILGLKVNLVLFVDRKAKAVAEEKRKGMEDRTRIIETTLQDIPYYKLRHRIAEIMNSTEYKKDNELVKMQLCEAFSPEYDIINWAKLYFVDRTVNENPFKNDFFIWLDGGYGHGKSIYPANHVWKPRGLFDHADKVTFIELKPGVGKYVTVKDKLHKISIAVMIGGFFAGGAVAMQDLYRLQRLQVSEWMEQGITDDDQTIYLTLYYKHPSLFRLVRGGWNDVFKLFNVGGS
ncbi:protein HtrL-like [Physella acuta]|uniref:protein HtrL-like n=1 Tax=Physella acuta TaxID=109671 RepID=UPI0027DB5093|nr:protein HtrL-like [Physella acuta]